MKPISGNNHMMARDLSKDIKSRVLSVVNAVRVLPLAGEEDNEDLGEIFEAAQTMERALARYHERKEIACR